MSSQRRGATHTICLFGDLDVATVDRVEAELERVEGCDARTIVLDLSGLKFLDSQGVHLLVRARDRSRADSARLRVVRGPDAVQRVLEICGVDGVLSFAD